MRNEQDVEYLVLLEEGVRKRHRHETDRGRVISFVVQLELLVGNAWQVVVRYDCAHGFCHQDRYDSKGNQTKTRLDLQFDNALTYADWDMNENWEGHCQSFLGGHGL
jgi:hypothetical protein